MPSSKVSSTYTPFGGKISKDVKSHSKDPHVVEKGHRAQETLKKTDIPNELLKIIKSR